MYDYDRRVKRANAGHILGLIVDKVLEDRQVESLIRAYNDEKEEDYEDTHGRPPHFESDREAAQWQRKTFNMLINRDEIEKALRDVYVAAYRRITGFPISSAEEVYEYPNRFPTHNVPRDIVDVVGRALARRDGMEALDLRERAMKK